MVSITGLPGSPAKDAFAETYTSAKMDDEAPLTRTKSVGEWELKDGKYYRKDVVSIDGLPGSTGKDPIDAIMEGWEKKESGSWVRREKVPAAAGSVRSVNSIQGDWEIKDGKWVMKQSTTILKSAELGANEQNGWKEVDSSGWKSAAEKLPSSIIGAAFDVDAANYWNASEERKPAEQVSNARRTIRQL